MPFPTLLAAIQTEPIGGETTGIIEGAADAAWKASEETGTVLKSVQAFFTGIIDYLTSPTFITNIVATVIILVLAIVFYRAAVSLIPRILQWRRPAKPRTPRPSPA